MVRTSHEHHSSGAWSLKDRHDAVVGSGRGRSVSTHILGLGIVLVGVLVLAVGLIMGLQFPDYVHQRIKEKQCVVNLGHEKYKSWSKGSQWSRKVGAYFWTLVNVDDFLYKGENPRFIQKGPYIYTETESKYDVSFAVTEVTYRLRRQFVFDQQATNMACNTCLEHDKLTIMSPWYLQTVGQHGGEESFSWTFIPRYTKGYLRTAGLLYKEHHDNFFSQNVSILGRYASGSTAALGQTLANFSFGAWLEKSRSDYRSTIRKLRSGEDFTLSEMKGLYSVLTNVTLLSGLALSHPDRNLRKNCTLWAESMCRPIAQRSKVNVGMPECGVIYILRKCQSNVSSDVVSALQQTFCPFNNAEICFNFTGLPEELLLAYQNAVSDFIWHLSSLVLDNILLSRDLSLVISRNQSELALGYNVSGDDVVRGYRVAGLLQSSWIGDTSDRRSLWKTYTCLEDRNMNNNMKVKEYNYNRSPSFEAARSPYKMDMPSFTDFVTSCPSLSTCQRCTYPSPSLNVYVEVLLRAVTFLLDNTTSIGGVNVFRYNLNPNTFDNFNPPKIASRLQNMADITGYLSWASLPSATDEKIIATDTSSTPSNSYVLIEPITGRVWERSIKLQWNAGISSETAHARGRNISFIEQPLPVFWTDKTATITSEEIRAYKHLVTRLMSVSCGGVIGFSVIAIIVVAVGIVVCVYPTNPNRVSPVAEESTNMARVTH